MIRTVLSRRTPVQRRRLVSLAIAGIAACLVLGYWLLKTGEPDSIDPSDAALVARGQVVYDQHCASCHGRALEGQPNWRSRLPNGRLPAPPHDASGHTWHHPDAVLVEITRDGIQRHAPAGYQSDMPAFGGTLDQRDIRAVLSYIKSTWPTDIQRRHDVLNRNARSRG